MTQNIVLAGFMGTGKSTVGRLVAKALGRPFVDLDERLAEEAGKPVPRIFAEDGEAAFRRMEARACRELARPQGVVVAVGGGAVLDPANCEALEAGGELICLEASEEALWQRLAGHDGRPMLAGADPRARMGELLAQRAAAYGGLPHQLDTTHLTPDEVAEQVMAIAAGLPEGNHLIPLALPDGTRYDIMIGPGLLVQSGMRIVAALPGARRAAQISNPTVAGLHGTPLRKSLAAAGIESFVLEAPDGEAYKTLATVSDLYAGLAAARAGRDEPVVALGGGVIGDMAGFVAATWLRGVPVVQIPTSLLAMVDASVGGKVAVDLPQGKNLVGAFKQPCLVLADTATLATLPAAQLRCGLAEIIKAGLIADPALFAGFEAASGEAAQAGGELLIRRVAASVRVKARIVSRDPFEQGDRAWLNLGHTFGHALELLSGFTLLHGEAVAIGTVAAAELSLRLGLCSPDLPARVRRAMAGQGLPAAHRFDPSAALAAMGTDKKRRGGRLRFVVIEAPGRVRVAEDAPEGDVLAALAATQEG
jgi:3-dehydroquinate synthase